MNTPVDRLSMLMKLAYPVDGRGGRHCPDVLERVSRHPMFVACGRMPLIRNAYPILVAIVAGTIAIVGDARCEAANEEHALPSQPAVFLRSVKASEEPAYNPLNEVPELNKSAFEYQQQGDFSSAEALFERSLSILRRTLGPSHPAVAVALGNVASLYQAQHRFSDAEAALGESLAVLQKAYGAEHVGIAVSLSNLAMLYSREGRYSEAERLALQATAMLEKLVGPRDPAVAATTNNLALIYENWGRLGDAERYYQRSLGVLESSEGPGSPAAKRIAANLARLYRLEHRTVDADTLSDRMGR